ncbi:MAG: beta-N-acetylhexosaminidase [Bacilli bacterium]|nr:beta-N-acetylhexosaminidase [Acholeplasmataceae bacterium]MDY2903258.1 beta-N-acetylhexosaminidase [Bacilli bacterium]
MKKVNEMTLKEKLGQLIIAGFDGYEYDEHLRTLIEDYKVGNIILFTRNIKDIHQLSALNRKIYNEILKNTGNSPLISIDQEGGMVTRIMDGATFCPGNMTLTATNNSDNAYIIGKIMGDELTHLGINMNLAPSLDVNNNPDNPVIGVRSYSDNPKVVSEYGNKFIKGLQEKGVIATAKHFPGHGDTNVDSHLGLPMINHTLEELEKVELVPFRSAIENGVDAIMSAHIVFSEIDKSGLPGTLSKTILTDLLRNKLNFKGLIVSDCMQMKAIDDQYTTERGTVMGIKAGLDIACISHSLDKQVGALRALEEAVETGEIDISIIDEKVKRILHYKELTRKKLESDFLSFSDDEIVNYFKNLNNQEIASKIVDESLTIFKGKEFVQTGKTLVIAATPFAQTIAEDKLDTRNIVDMLREFVKTVDAETLDLKQEDYSDLINKAKNYDQIVVCSYNANNYPNQVKLINDLNNLGKDLYVISTRNPYDYLVLDEIDNLACLYEYTKNSVGTIMRYLSGMIKPKGKFPINANNKLNVSASIYVGLEDYSLKNNIKYLHLLKENGIDSVFVSAHMPEMSSTFTNELKEILNECKKLNIKVIIDVNKNKLLEMEKEGTLAGIYSLRLDYGFSNNEIVEMIKKGYNIELNASVVNKETMEYLKANGVDLSNFRISHNFYPKKYTGLSYEFVLEKNKYFKSLGCYVVLYIPSHHQHRPPMYEGLPTLEAHRDAPLTEILSEAKILGCNEVCFGDAFCSEEEIKYATTFDSGIIQIPVIIKKECDENVVKNLLKVQYNRIDETEYFVRSSVRSTNIKPFNTVNRYVKDVTIDNELFKRYQGEICIMKKNIEADERVNVVGKCNCNEFLINNIKAGQKFKLVIDQVIAEEAIIGIDAGGTKTKVALIDANKEIVYSAIGGSGSPAVDPNALNTIYNLIKEVYDLYNDKYNIKAVVMGVSGVYTIENRHEFLEKIENDFNTTAILESDALLALYSIVQDKYEEGLLILAGTGTAIMGLNKDKSFLASGWGQLLNEHGSAYACVKDYVCEMIDDYEDKGEFTEFGKKLMQHLGYTDLQEFKKLFYRHSKDEVASSSKFFYEEAKKGDKEAQKWLYHNGEMLADNALDAIRHLKMSKRVVIGFRGGFASNVHYVQEGVIDTLKKNGIEPIVVKGDLDPIYGSFYMAKRKGALC